MHVLAVRRALWASWVFYGLVPTALIPAFKPESQHPVAIVLILLWCALGIAVWSSTLYVRCSILRLICKAHKEEAAIASPQSLAAWLREGWRSAEIASFLDWFERGSDELRRSRLYLYRGLRRCL